MAGAGQCPTIKVAPNSATKASTSGAPKAQAKPSLDGTKRPHTPTRDMVTVVPRGPEGRTLRGGGGGRSIASATEEASSRKGAGEPDRFDMCEAQAQGIFVEYDAVDQGANDSTQGTAIQQCATLQGEGMSASTAGVLRELQASPHVGLEPAILSLDLDEKGCVVQRVAADLQEDPERLLDGLLPEEPELPDECF